ncbi:MAG: Asp-tRNA(Asn)/Glu-tRNA(Gln) amidotransferase subunit GatC [Clostridiales bacterium]|jgi:aspartyl/glutamyl-tRNA(Asn/Gln) amidotransferase C subunit|nr:Asp-tRNA(Asn)/Glu-tRNA(Gln) amidotransferase subunit GatC [Clostridiales bacterium]
MAENQVEINDELIDYLQGLMRLRLTDAEREKTKGDLKKVLGYVSTLSDAPDYEVAYNFAAEADLREDAPSGSFPRGEILRNAPRKSDEYFKAAKAVES